VWSLSRDARPGMTLSGRHDTLNPVIPTEEPGPIHMTVVQLSAASSSVGVMGPGFGFAAPG
jgi:hypothetical protein